MGSFSNKLIGEKFNTVVIRYSPEKGKYEYRGFSHHAEKNALDDIANLIIDDMIFYAFSENEILRLNDDIDLLDELEFVDVKNIKEGVNVKVINHTKNKEFEVSHDLNEQQIKMIRSGGLLNMIKASI